MANENESSGAVVKGSLSVGAATNADPAVRDYAKPVLDKRKTLKQAMRARQDAEDEVIIVDGTVVVAELDTDGEIRAFGPKVIGHLATKDQPGEQSAQFKRLFADATPATVLPEGTDGRRKALGELKKRIQSPQTPAAIKKDAAPLLEAIDQELASADNAAKATKAFEQAQEFEEHAKIDTVVAVRACTNLVKAKYASNPARARRILGLANPGARRSKADEAKRKAAEAQKARELARKADAIATRLEEEAKIAADEAAAEAQEKEAKKSKKSKKSGRTGETVP